MDNYLPTLYTFRRCPFAIRARWAILKTNQRVIWREVSLSDKPLELYKASIKGTVPVLIDINGLVLDESIDIMLWCLRQSSDKGLKSFYQSSYSDTVQKLIYENDHVFKVHLDRFKYSNRFPNVKKDFHLKEACQILSSWNQRLLENSDNNQKWLNGSFETIADWAIWPFVRQFRNAYPSFDSEGSFSELSLWLNRFTSDSQFDILMSKRDPWKQGDKPIIFPNNAISSLLL